MSPPTVLLAIVVLLSATPVDVPKILNRVEAPQIEITLNCVTASSATASPDRITYGPTKALALARGYAGKHPTDLSAQVRLAKALDAADRKGEAKSVYRATASAAEKTLRKKPNEASALVALADCKRALADHGDADAIRLYRKAIAADPKNWRAHAGLGAALFWAPYYSELAKTAEPASWGTDRAFVGSETAIDELVQAYPKALAEYAKAVAAAPASVDPLLEKSQWRMGAVVILQEAYRQTKRGFTPARCDAEMAAARDDLAAAGRVRPHDIGIATYLLAHSIFQLSTSAETPAWASIPGPMRDELARSASALEAYLARAPMVDATGSYRLLAMYWLLREDWPKVRETGEALLKVSPASATGIDIVAGSFLSQNDKAGLRSWVLKRLQVKDAPRARQILGKLMIDLGAFEPAVVELQKVAAGRNPPAGTHNLLGYALLKLGKYAEAEPEMKQAARESPKDARVLFTHAVSLIALNKIDEARVVLGKCLKADPSYTRGRLTLNEIKK